MMNGHPPCPHPPTLHFPPLLPGSDIPRGALLFQSDDLEHARTRIGRIYRPYRFTAGERRTMPVTMFKLDGNGMALTWFAYGTDISIRPEICGNFALVLTTLAGHSEARSGRVEQVGGTGSTVLVASNARSAFRYSADNVQLGMRIDAGRVGEQLPQDRRFDTLGAWPCGRRPSGGRRRRVPTRRSRLLHRVWREYGDAFQFD
ncbi:hypothetical protein [Burkholderia ubonensis]|uniref:AraC-like ligand-binding domain-containing protein n=1 Tax=Burkholderia ubonensis TaxID=101571 RepID=UPI0012FB6465